MATFLTTPTSISLSGITTNTWTTFSSGAPAGTTGVILNFGTTTGNSTAITTRMSTGSGGPASPDTQTNAVVNGSACQTTSITGVNGSGQFDLFITAGSASTVSCWLVGYFGGEANFLGGNAQIGAALTSSYQNYTISGAPGALVVFVDIFSSGSQIFVRKNGSTDTENYSGGQSYICGVDGSGIFNGKNGNVGGTPYIKGYMTGGVVWHTNMLVVGGSFTGGSFQNVAQGAGDPAASGILGYSYYTSGAGKFTICGNGCNTSTYNPQLAQQISGGAGMVFGGPAPAQINPVNSTQVLNETAYFTPTQLPINPFQLYGLQPTLAQ